MRCASSRACVFAALLSGLAGCEITVEPPQSSRDQSKPHAIQVPPAQAAVIGQAAQREEQPEKTTTEPKRADNHPTVEIGQRDAKSKRARVDSEKAADRPVP